MLVVISYDISDDGTRQSVFKELLNWGHPVQKSVFEAHLSDEQVSRMRENLSRLLQNQEDSIRIYRLCARCQQRCVYMGNAEPTVETDVWIV